MKRLFSPHHGHDLVVGGRRRAPAHGRRLHLAKYIKREEIAVPDCDYSPGALGLTNVLGNDRLGDCTCAGAGHMIEVITAAAGSPVEITTEQVIALYEATCGYKPGDPTTDRGGDEYSVLAYLAERGFDGQGLHKIFGSVVINATEWDEVRFAQFAFGALYHGQEMPDSFISPFPSGPGFVWDVGGEPNPDNGHCFITYGANTDSLLVDTWGLLGHITKGAVAKYGASVAGGEIHVPITREWLNAASQRSPSGLAWDELLADLERLGGVTS